MPAQGRGRRFYEDRHAFNTRRLRQSRGFYRGRGRGIPRPMEPHLTQVLTPHQGEHEAQNMEGQDEGAATTAVIKPPTSTYRILEREDNAAEVEAGSSQEGNKEVATAHQPTTATDMSVEEFLDMYSQLSPEQLGGLGRDPKFSIFTLPIYAGPTVLVGAPPTTVAGFENSTLQDQGIPPLPLIPPQLDEASLLQAFPHPNISAPVNTEQEVPDSDKGKGKEVVTATNPSPWGLQNALQVASNGSDLSIQISPSLQEFARQAFGLSAQASKMSALAPGFVPAQPQGMGVEQMAQGHGAQEVQNQHQPVEMHPSLVQPSQNAQQMPIGQAAQTSCVPPQSSFDFTVPASMRPPEFGSSHLQTAAQPRDNQNNGIGNAEPTSGIPEQPTGTSVTPPGYLPLPFEDSDGEDDFFPPTGPSLSELRKRKEMGEMMARQHEAAESTEKELPKNTLGHGKAKSQGVGQPTHAQTRLDTRVSLVTPTGPERLTEALELVKKLTTWAPMHAGQPLPPPLIRPGTYNPGTEPPLRKCPGFKPLEYAAPFWAMTANPAFLSCDSCYHKNFMGTPFSAQFARTRVLGGRC